MTSSGLLSAALSKKKQHFFDRADSNFQSSLPEIPKTLAAPGEAFLRYAESYQIQKGALLVVNENHRYFTPLTSLGYDLTTVRRIRFPVADFTLEVPKLYCNNDLFMFRPYFSVREYTLLDNLLLIPGWDSGNIISLLLVTEGEDFIFSAPPTFPDYLINFIKDHHFKTEQIQIDSEIAHRNFVEIDDFIENKLRNNESLCLAILQYSKIIDYLKKTHPEGDPYTIFQRGVLFTAGQLKNSCSNSEIFLLPGSNLLLTVTGVPCKRSSTLFYQAMLTLRSRFGPVQRVPQVEFFTTLAPDKGMTIFELFPQLSKSDDIE